MTLPRAVWLRVVDGREVLHRERIVCKLHQTDVVETSPDEILLVELLDVTRVDAVLHAYFRASEKFAFVGKLGGSIAYCNTNTRSRAVTPKR